jgi:sugar-specific transcriptional regulator TrmB
MSEDFPSALEEYKQLLQQYKTANFPEANFRLHNLLRCLGLSKYEIQVYIALVEDLQELNVTQIVKKSGVPHPRAYDTLKNLVKYGLITAKTRLNKVGDQDPKRMPVTYRAFKPSIGIENLFAFFTFAKEEAKKEIQKLTNLHVRSESGIWEIIGWDNIINTIKLLIDEATHEVLLTTDLLFIQKIRHALIAASGRKVLISCVTNYEEGTDLAYFLEDLAFLRLKYRKHYPMPYIIIDRSHAIQWNFSTFDKHRQIDPEFTRAQVIEQIELIDTLIDHFFFLNWRYGNNIGKLPDIPSPVTLIHSISVVEEVERLLSKNTTILARVRGIRNNSAENVILDGTVTRFYKNWDSGVFTIYLKTEEGSEISVGGFGAIYEDVAADQVTLSVL